MPEVWTLMLGFAAAAVLAAVAVYAFNYHKTRFALGSAVIAALTFLMTFGLAFLVAGVMLIFNLPS